MTAPEKFKHASRSGGKHVWIPSGQRSHVDRAGGYANQTLLVCELAPYIHTCTCTLATAEDMFANFPLPTFCSLLLRRSCMCFGCMCEVIVACGLESANTITNRLEQMSPHPDEDRSYHRVIPYRVV